MLGEAICPKCNEILLLDDYEECLEYDFNTGSHLRRCSGKCPKCGKRYVWQEVWDYEGVIDITEERDE